MLKSAYDQTSDSDCTYKLVLLATHIECGAIWPSRSLDFDVIFRSLPMPLIVVKVATTDERICQVPFIIEVDQVRSFVSSPGL